MPGLGRGGAAEPGEHEGGRSDAHRAEHEGASSAAHAHDADDGSREDRERHRPPARGCVAQRPPEVSRHRAGSAELLAAPADADVEALHEHEIREPEREAEDEYCDAGGDRLLQAVARRDEDVGPLAREEQHRVRVRRDRRGAPSRPRAPSARGRLARARAAGRASTRGSRTGRRCTSGRRRRGRERASSARRAPWRRAPPCARPAGARGAPRAAGSRPRRAPRRAGGRRARTRGAPLPRRAGSGGARRRAPVSRARSPPAASPARRRARASRPRAAARP